MAVRSVRAALRVLFLAGLVFVGALPSHFASAQKQPSSFAKTPAPKFTSPNKLDKTQPLYLNGDELTYDNAGNRVVAKGNVELSYNSYQVSADEITYDQAAGTLTASGNVIIKDPNGQITRADRIDMTDDFKEGFVEALSVVATDDTRIAARRAIRKDGNVTEFTDGRYTPCKSQPGMPPLWCISAARIIHDQNAATLTYQDAALEFFGVPVIPLPFFEHPDPSVKRRSGFLIPGFGSSSTLGTSVEIPYYFALAPNYDFTFRPELLSKQGVLWQGDWRHRLANGAYEVKLAGIDQDAANLEGGAAANAKLDGWRGSLATKGQFSLSSWWKAGWDITVESDDTFRRFYKLDNALLSDRVNQIYLEGQSDRNYFGMKLYQFGGLLLSDTKQSESRAHPVIDHDYVFADPVLGGELALSTSALSLTRESTINGAFSESYNHVKSEVKWRRRLTDALGISYTPFGQLRGDAYLTDNVINPETNTRGDEQTFTRGLATGGVTVAYPWVANGFGASHVIEPIGQAIVSQASVRQRQLANEDARSVVFDDTNLFEPQKFSGTDRVETGTRVNAGIQYTFQANSGGYARLLAGQHFQLSGDNAYQDPGKITEVVNVSGVPTIQNRFVFSPSSGLEKSRSDYVLGAYLAPNSTFRFLAQSRFDENDLGLRRQDLFASVNYGPVAATGIYSFTAADPLLGIEKSQSDITGIASLRLTDFWSVIGTIRYDIDAAKVLTDSVSLRYADDCFVLSTTLQQTFLENAALGLREDTSLMFRVEFKSIGGFNYKTSILDHTFGDNQKP
jgi:LPS-assembly protein